MKVTRNGSCFPLFLIEESLRRKSGAKYRLRRAHFHTNLTTLFPKAGRRSHSLSSIEANLTIVGARTLTGRRTTPTEWSGWLEPIACMSQRTRFVTSDSTRF